MSGAIVLLLAAVFLMAALSKLRSQNHFAAVLQNLIPNSLTKPAALAIPLAELMLAVVLLSGIGVKTAVITAMVVLAGFTVSLVVMWRRGVKGCGCFGEEEDTATTGNGIIRNLILIALAGLVVAGPPSGIVYGPDFSTGLAQVTVAAGALCLWPCMVALVDRRKYFFNLK